MNRAQTWLCLAFTSSLPISEPQILHLKQIVIDICLIVTMRFKIERIYIFIFSYLEYQKNTSFFLCDFTLEYLFKKFFLPVLPHQNKLTQAYNYNKILASYMVCFQPWLFIRCTTRCQKPHFVYIESESPGLWVGMRVWLGLRTVDLFLLKQKQSTILKTMDLQRYYLPYTGTFAPRTSSNLLNHLQEINAKKDRNIQFQKVLYKTKQR